MSLDKSFLSRLSSIHQAFDLAADSDGQSDHGKDVPAPPQPPKPQRIVEFGQPLDALSPNRSRTRVVVGGTRGVLCVVNVTASTLEQGMMFRGSKRKNLMYNPSHVDWNQNRESAVATTSATGHVILWNAEKGVSEHSYKSHTRSATVVRFHNKHEYMMCSGSKDARVYMYDIREKEHVAEFCTGSFETIRDLSFFPQPDREHLFVTGDDSGTLRFWDIRFPTPPGLERGSRPYLQFPAHQGYLASVAVHPERYGLIATGGARDRVVKVWDWTTDHFKCDMPSYTPPNYSVETMAPLGRIYWRPGCPYQIATCSVVNDMNVHVWDIRRPFLPIYSFEDHCDSCTDMGFDPNNSKVFVTCGKDGRVVLHNTEKATLPHSFANDVAFSIAPDGLFAVAVNSQIFEKYCAVIAPTQEWFLSPNMRMRHASKCNMIQNRRIVYDPHRAPIRSNIAAGVPDMHSEADELARWHDCANDYRLGGAPIAQLCSYNARIAEANRFYHVAQTWRLLEALCQQCTIEEEKETEERRIRNLYLEGIRGQILDKYRLTNYMCDMPDAVSQVAWRLQCNVPEDSEAYYMMHYWQNSEDYPPFDNEEPLEPYMPPLSFSISTLSANSQFYFGDGELSGCCQTDCDRAQPSTATFPVPFPFISDWRVLKDEAFETTPVQPSTVSRAKSYSPLSKIAEVLKYHSDQGDIQTCACVSVVLGFPLYSQISERTILAWQFAYLDMLDRLELFVAAATIRKYSDHKEISAQALKSTHIPISCIPCGSQINTELRKCEKCNREMNRCVICEGRLLAMQWQCRFCRHPMHLDEMTEWFTSNSRCPMSGCECICKLGKTETQLLLEKRLVSQERRFKTNVRSMKEKRKALIEEEKERRKSMSKRQIKKEREIRRSIRSELKRLVALHSIINYYRKMDVYVNSDEEDALEAEEVILYDPVLKLPKEKCTEENWKKLRRRRRLQMLRDGDGDSSVSSDEEGSDDETRREEHAEDDETDAMTEDTVIEVHIEDRPMKAAAPKPEERLQKVLRFLDEVDPDNSVESADRKESVEVDGEPKEKKLVSILRKSSEIEEIVMESKKEEVIERGEDQETEDAEDAANHEALLESDRELDLDVTITEGISESSTEDEEADILSDNDSESNEDEVTERDDLLSFVSEHLDPFPKKIIMKWLKKTFGLEPFEEEITDEGSDIDLGVVERAPRVRSPVTIKPWRERSDHSRLLRLMEESDPGESCSSESSDEQEVEAGSGVEGDELRREEKYEDLEDEEEEEWDSEEDESFMFDAETYVNFDKDSPVDYISQELNCLEIEEEDNEVKDEEIKDEEIKEEELNEQEEVKENKVDDEEALPNEETLLDEIEEHELCEGENESEPGEEEDSEEECVGCDGSDCEEEFECCSDCGGLVIDLESDDSDSSCSCEEESDEEEEDEYEEHQHVKHVEREREPEDTINNAETPCNSLVDDGDDNKENAEGDSDSDTLVPEDVNVQYGCDFPGCQETEPFCPDCREEEEERLGKEGIKSKKCECEWEEEESDEEYYEDEEDIHICRCEGKMIYLGNDVWKELRPRYRSPSFSDSDQYLSEDEEEGIECDEEVRSPSPPPPPPRSLKKVGRRVTFEDEMIADSLSYVGEHIEEQEDEQDEEMYETDIEEEEQDVEDMELSPSVSDSNDDCVEYEEEEELEDEEGGDACDVDEEEETDEEEEDLEDDSEEEEDDYEYEKDLNNLEYLEEMDIPTDRISNQTGELMTNDELIQLLNVADKVLDRFEREGESDEETIDGEHEIHQDRRVRSRGTMANFTSVEVHPLGAPRCRMFGGVCCPPEDMDEEEAAALVEMADCDVHRVAKRCIQEEEEWEASSQETCSSVSFGSYGWELRVKDTKLAPLPVFKEITKEMLDFAIEDVQIVDEDGTPDDFSSDRRNLVPFQVTREIENWRRKQQNGDSTPAPAYGRF